MGRCWEFVLLALLGMTSLVGCGHLWSSLTLNSPQNNNLVPRTPMLTMIAGCRGVNCVVTSAVVQASVDGLTWNTIGNIATEATESAVAAVINGNFFLFGGCGASTCDNNFVTASGNYGATWTTQPSLPTVRAGAGGLSYNGKFYLIGGTDSDDFGTPRQDVISTSDGLSWTTVTTALPITVAAEAVTVFNGYMWMMGGYTTSGFNGLTGAVYRSSDGATWTLMSNLPTAICGAQAAVFNNKMWVVGGVICLVAIREVLLNRCSLPPTE